MGEIYEKMSLIGRNLLPDPRKASYHKLRALRDDAMLMGLGFLYHWWYDENGEMRFNLAVHGAEHGEQKFYNLTIEEVLMLAKGLEAAARVFNWEGWHKVLAKYDLAEEDMIDEGPSPAANSAKSGQDLFLST